MRCVFGTKTDWVESLLFGDREVGFPAMSMSVLAERDGLRGPICDGH